jgi:hypothetical protein
LMTGLIVAGLLLALFVLTLLDIDPGALLG